MISKKLSEQVLEGSLTHSKNFLAGTYKGYYITIDYKQPAYIVYIHATPDNSPGKAQLESFLIEHQESMQYLSKAEAKDHVVKLRIMDPKQKKIVVSVLNDTIEPVIRKLLGYKYNTGCINCGDNNEDVACYQVSGFHHYLCEKCIVDLKQGIVNNQTKSADLPVNPLLGTIGAICASIIGVILWVYLYSHNMFAWLSGLAIVFLAYKGYELLGKRLDKKGFIICTVIICIMVFLGNHLGWAWSSLDMENLQSYSMKEVLLLKEVWNSTDKTIRYILEMLAGYVLTFALAFQIIKGTYRRSTGTYSIKKMEL